jgi:deoxycytidylate deaminase
VKRRDKHNYYLDIAQTVLERGTCLRRNYGAIIVKNDEIISTGYTGAPRHRKNCTDIGICRRETTENPARQRDETVPFGARRGKLHNQCFKKGYAWFGNVFGRKRHEYG